MSNIKHIEQLESCGFECEAGPLEKNVSFIALKQIIADGPQHSIGDKVWFSVTAEANGVTLRQYVQLTVCGINATGHNQTSSIEYLYSLAAVSLVNVAELPVLFKGIQHDALFTEKPDNA